jgi:hypothetical protein
MQYEFKRNKEAKRIERSYIGRDLKISAYAKQKNREALTAEANG